MPRIGELLDSIGKVEYISTLDLTWGHWQVPVAENDRPKTAFTTPLELYQIRAMPLEWSEAPATFQRLMDRVLAGLDGSAAAYMDDVVIFSIS